MTMPSVNTTISPVDALWALYQAQSKANKKKFRTLIKEEEQKERSVANAKSFIASGKSREDFDNDNYITLKSHEDIERWFNSL